MNVLVACECSGRIKMAFRKRGHNAWSCDIKPSEIEGDKYHIQDDVNGWLNGFWLPDNRFIHFNDIRKWDLIIANPPCTYLSKAGGWCWQFREKEIEQSFSFVKAIWSAQADRICIENPIGWLNTHWRKPTQIIHPYYFGEPFLKETCLWLKGLPRLKYALKDDMFQKATAVQPVANWVKPGNIRNRRFNEIPEGAGRDKTNRSRTFQGVANAMAEQWG